MVFIGFDAEWTDASHEDEEIPPGSANRVLSWQLFLFNPSTDRSCGVFVEAKSAHKASRKLLKTLIGLVVNAALQKGVLDRLPDRVILAAHFSRADLSTVRDFSILKRKLGAVRTTYATSERPIYMGIPSDRGEASICVRVVDTMLLSPNGSSLAALGDALGIPKIELPEGFSKERMDIFFAADPPAFRGYAMTDAEIAALWAARVLGIVKNEMGVKRQVPTLGAVAVEMIHHEIKAVGLDVLSFLGRQKRSRGGKAQPFPDLVGKWEFAAQCYHGGRNEALSVGFSPDGRDVHDLDLVSAYTTALAMIRAPDWPTSRYTKALDELATVEGAMTFAHVEFCFPPETRAPSLPVRASNGRGLIYPLEGQSWCTGPELVVALAQGARIGVHEGLRIDWVLNSPRPFEAFTRKINRIRSDAKATEDSVLDKTAKEIGNSGYGKLAQAVAGQRTIADDRDPRRVFNTKTEKMQDLGESRITQPMMAAFTTGLVRAAVSEALAELGPEEWIGTVTTDGILTTAPLERIRQSGAVVQAFAAARARITPDKPAIWEEKHHETSVFVIKNRGTVSCTPSAEKPILAKAGHKLERRYESRSEEALAMMELVRSRDYETRLTTKSLISLRHQHLTDGDLTPVSRRVRANLDFDLKRRIISPHDVDGLLTAETAPWKTIEEFEDARDGLEEWKKSTRRVMKKVEDYRAMGEWVRGVSLRRAAGIKADNSLGPLPSAFLKIAALGQLGLKRIPDAVLADYMSKLSGVDIPIAKIWNARRRGKDIEDMLGAVAGLADADQAFVRRLYTARRLMVLQIVVPPLEPSSEALRQLDAIMKDEDERQLAREHQEWLDGLPTEPDLDEECPVTQLQNEISPHPAQPTDAIFVNGLA